MIISNTEIEVRYSETDMMGVAHHSAYLPWLELARGNLLKENGISYAELEESGVLLPVVQIQMNYRRPALYDDIITVRAIIKERPFAKIRVEYELFKNGEPIASGHSVHAFVNRSGQPMKSPEGLVDMWRKAFG